MGFMIGLLARIALRRQPLMNLKVDAGTRWIRVPVSQGHPHGTLI
jgi:hypothetical protein